MFICTVMHHASLCNNFQCTMRLQPMVVFLPCCVSKSNDCLRHDSYHQHCVLSAHILAPSAVFWAPWSIVVSAIHASHGWHQAFNCLDHTHQMEEVVPNRAVQQGAGGNTSTRLQQEHKGDKYRRAPFSSIQILTRLAGLCLSLTIYHR